MRAIRLVGGPWDGETIDVQRGVSQIAVMGNTDWCYHLTRDYSVTPDPLWFVKGLPEPTPPERFFEWHPVDWVDPAVAWIRGVVEDASNEIRSR